MLWALSKELWTPMIFPPAVLCNIASNGPTLPLWNIALSLAATPASW
jgi:hypothetical protein